MKKLMLTSLIGVLACMLLVGSAFAEQTEFNLAWSHYTGWEPIQYMVDSGILKKHADANKIKIIVTLINDYVESINQYTSGKFDACAMTNMDALTIPSVAGVESTALIVGDFSNGNDGLLCTKCEKAQDLKGRELFIVQNSVSHYGVSRFLDQNNMKESDLKIMNTSDADIAAVYKSKKSEKNAVMTWNPMLQDLALSPDVKLLFDSSKIPGEIIDMIVVKTKASNAFKKALVGAWFETMKHMSDTSTVGEKARSAMAKSAGGTLAQFNAQLKTTKMFYNASEAVTFTKSADLKKTMDLVRTFSFDHGLMEGAKSKDDIGIKFPDGSVLGNASKVRLYFDATYMENVQNLL